MSATRAEVYAAIDGEREYQLRLWGRGEADNPLAEGEFVLLAEEYLAMARREWVGEEKPCARTLDVMRKVAAIAVACMEQHGAPHRLPIPEMG